MLFFTEWMCFNFCFREAVSTWRTQRTAGEMHKYKVQVFLFKPQRLLEIQIAEAVEWRGLWTTVKKLWFRFSSIERASVPSALLRWLQLIQSEIWSAFASAGISLFFTRNSASGIHHLSISSRSKSGYELYGRSKRPEVFIQNQEFFVVCSLQSKIKSPISLKEVI